MGEKLAYADGSKDLYPRGIRGNRAFLISRAEDTGNTNFPFPTYGTHYVYVRAGETLATASSAAYIGDGAIEITKPNGERISSNTVAGNTGQIRDAGRGTRAAELDGPRIGYDAWEILVGPEDEGIWRVDFYGADRTVMSYARSVPSVAADADWIQEYHYYVAAWDISVRDVTDSQWVAGRVFTNVLSLHINSWYISNRDGAFYGVNYVLTNDGYIYKVDGNGSNGIAFTYFVNNKGFLDPSREPIYRSMSNVHAVMGGAVHDPRGEDTRTLVTHKIMYTLPDTTMPEEALGAVPGGSTWLIQPKIAAEITNIRLEGVEGESHWLTKKGAYISFETSMQASYQVTIKSKDPNIQFVERTIIVHAQVGENRYHWDGLDGAERLLPIGEDYPIHVEIEMLGGEVHFPYIDMEINPQGILISRLDNELNGEIDAIVYWDDRDIPDGIPSERSNPQVNLSGILSRVNGHRWGTYSDQTVPSTQENNNNQNYGGFSYGNNMAMDTWSYSLSVSDSIIPDITVRIADLEVSHIEADKSVIELEEEVTYRVTVYNNGPSDVNGASFQYEFPAGFSVHDVQVESDCGAAQDIRVEGSAILAIVDLPDECDLIFIISVSASSEVADETYGYYPTEGSVVRPLGTTDPDATSLDLSVSAPVSADVECAGSIPPCNNIRRDNSVFLLEPYNERGQLALIKSAEHIDANENGYHDVGEELRYTFTLRNIGEVNVNTIRLFDEMLSDNAISFPATILAPGEVTTVTRAYSITQVDIDREYILNSAATTGLNPRGFQVIDTSGNTASDNNPTTVYIYRTPLVYLQKTVENSGTGENDQFTIGDVIRYRFTILNQEDFPVHDLVLKDELLTPTMMDIGTIIPGAIHDQAFGSYQVTQLDIDRGYAANAATLHGFDNRVDRPLEVRSGTTFDNRDSTITPLARPPRANDDEFTQYSGSSSLHDVLTNDVEGSSTIDRQMIEILEYPQSGSLEVHRDGTVTYTSAYAFTGSDSYSYRVMDASRLWSDVAMVYVTVEPTVVVAEDDFIELNYNREVERNVLLNDYTIGGSTIVPNTIELLSWPQQGQLINGYDGSFTYRPFRNYTGYDQFTYRVRDDAGFWSNEGVVTLEVRGLFVPNVLTPNGDGYNDTFFIIGLYAFERVELEIVDRFGNVVYKSTNYNNEWMGEDLDDGTYYYVLRAYQDGRQTFSDKGAVTLIRELVPQ